jgi:hypothetical protein
MIRIRAPRRSTTLSSVSQRSSKDNETLMPCDTTYEANSDQYFLVAGRLHGFRATFHDMSSEIPDSGEKSAFWAVPTVIFGRRVPAPPRSQSARKAGGGGNSA